MIVGGQIIAGDGVTPAEDGVRPDAGRLWKGRNIGHASGSCARFFGLDKWRVIGYTRHR